MASTIKAFRPLEDGTWSATQVARVLERLSWNAGGTIKRKSGRPVSSYPDPTEVQRDF